MSFDYAGVSFLFAAAITFVLLTVVSFVEWSPRHRRAIKFLSDSLVATACLVIIWTILKGIGRIIGAY